MQINLIETTKKYRQQSSDASGPNKGKLIVIYGINNLGKTTQAKLLVKKLQEQGYKAEYLKYPIYDLAPSGVLLNNYLRHGNLYKLCPREAQIIYALNRLQYESTLKQKLEQGIHIIAEDYTGTGLAWGIGAGVDENFLKYINSKLFKEDLAILLDGQRFSQAIENGHKHEKDGELTQRVRSAHLHLAQERNWKIINANQPIETVHQLIWQKVGMAIRLEPESLDELSQLIEQSYPLPGKPEKIKDARTYDNGFHYGEKKVIKTIDKKIIEIVEKLVKILPKGRTYINMVLPKSKPAPLLANGRDGKALPVDGSLPHEITRGTISRGKPTTVTPSLVSNFIKSLSLSKKYLPVKKLIPDAKLPTRAHPDDAGLDLYAADNYTLFENEKQLISTGISLAVPKGSVGLIWDKGSTSLKGLHTLAGVLDSDYRGELKVVIFNISNDIVHIAKGEKIAQLLIQKIETPEVREVEDLASTERGEGGFGSTGEF